MAPTIMTQSVWPNAALTRLIHFCIHRPRFKHNTTETPGVCGRYDLKFDERTLTQCSHYAVRRGEVRTISRSTIWDFRKIQRAERCTRIIGVLRVKVEIHRYVC